MLLSLAETNNEYGAMASHHSCLPGSEPRRMWRSSSYGTWEIMTRTRNRGLLQRSVMIRCSGGQEVGHRHSTGEISE